MFINGAIKRFDELPGVENRARSGRARTINRKPETMKAVREASKRATICKQLLQPMKHATNEGNQPEGLKSASPCLSVGVVERQP